MTELLRAAPGRVRRLSFERGREFPELVQLAGRARIEISVVEREIHDSLVGPGLARGVLAIADPPRDWDFQDLLEREDGPVTRRGHRLIVVCDGVVDPHNLGAVIRSAEFFGAAGVVWPRDRSASLTAAAVRSSAGASERLALCQLTNLARALEQAAEAGDWWVVGDGRRRGSVPHRVLRRPTHSDVAGGRRRGARAPSPDPGPLRLLGDHRARGGRSVRSTCRSRRPWPWLPRVTRASGGLRRTEEPIKTGAGLA